MTELEKLVAKVMSNAFMGEPSMPSVVKQPKVKKPKKHRITRKLDQLSDEQKQILLLLLSEKLATVCVRGETYIYRRIATGWLIRSLHDAEPEHTVSADFTACSCKDFKCRNRECKHLHALKEILACPETKS